jgi:hypothetical protein
VSSAVPRGNPDLLRSDIDSGRTGDKVEFPDPAAAPLGTDEEAAGTPVTPAQVRAAVALETAHSVAGRGPQWWPLLLMAGVAGLVIFAAGIAIWLA